MSQLLHYVVTICLVAKSPYTIPAETDLPMPAGVANRAWMITTVVLENHVAPPSRQDMLLGGIKALLKQGHAVISADLSTRVSNVAKEDQWSELLSDLWPKDTKTSTAALESALLTGVLHSVSGNAHLVSVADRKAIEGFAGNRYVGTGVQIDYNSKEKLARLISPIRNGPAHKAGARPGDLILEVDGVNAHDVGLRKVVDWLRGEEGTDVSVVVQQPDSDEKRTLKITRGVSPIETVLGYERRDETRWNFRPDSDAPVGYIAITSFNSSTLHELKAMEAPLRAEGVEAVVLDLRFAQGGSAHNAGLVADGLLDGGVMWRLRDARQNVRECRADRECLFRGCGLVVLVDQLTSAPAAWVACALNDSGRATVVGQMIVRDGFTKSFVDVPGGQHSLEIATGFVERVPNRKKSAHPDLDEGDGETERGTVGRWIVQPDHLVSATVKQRAAIHQWINDKLQTEPTSPDSATPEDAQLRKAIELLRTNSENTRK